MLITGYFNESTKASQATNDDEADVAGGVYPSNITS